MSTSLFQYGWVQSWMRTPAWRNLFAGLVSRRAIISACSRSRPAWAPSSQSQVTSKIGPSFAWISKAFTISFSLPAKCSHDGITGNGRSPLNKAAWGWSGLDIGLARPAPLAEELADGIPLLVQLLQRRVHALAREIADVDALHDLVPPAAGGRRVAVDHA